MIFLEASDETYVYSCKNKEKRNQNLKSISISNHSSQKIPSWHPKHNRTQLRSNTEQSTCPGKTEDFLASNAARTGTAAAPTTSPAFRTEK